MIISRYLSREIVSAVLAVMAILLLAFLSQQVVRYLNYVAIGKIPTNILLELVSFEISYLLALLLPLGLYLGLLLTYGRLYADNEMTIMQMSGYGSGRILRLTAWIALAVSAIVLYLMLWINPGVSAKRQALMSSDEASLHLIETLVPGRFQASVDGRHVMYVEKLSRDHKLAENVFLAQEKKNPEEEGMKSWTLVLANQGFQMNGAQSDGPFFVTTDGYRYEGVPGQNDYKITQFKKYAIHVPQPELRASHQISETLSTWQLWLTYQDPKHAAELQWRFSIGIACFFLALLAVPLSNLQPRQGRYLVLLPAILIYIIYIETLVIARHWVEQSSVPIFLGMWWVHALMVLFIFIVVLAKSRFAKR